MAKREKMSTNEMSIQCFSNRLFFYNLWFFLTTNYLISQPNTINSAFFFTSFLRFQYNLSRQVRIVLQRLNNKSLPGNKKKMFFFTHFSCTHGRMCVYGRYAPWPDVPRMLPTEQYLDLDFIDFKDFCLSLSSSIDFT